MAWVEATMTRLRDIECKLIKDNQGDCYLVRNKTKILFDSSDEKIGSVIMSNPGSFKLDIGGWDKFKEGADGIDEISGTGALDPTLRNIAKMIQLAFTNVGKVPKGYIEVYNLSSVVNPDSSLAEEYHDYAMESSSQDLLNKIIDPVVTDHKKITHACQDPQFIIIGFVQAFLTAEAQQIQNWCINHFNGRTIYISQETKNWPCHPLIWYMRKINMITLGDLASKRLEKII